MPDIPHYSVLSRRAPAALSAKVRAELDAHTFAAWKSRDGQTFRVYGLPLPGDLTSYMVRQREADEQSTEPIAAELLLAEYTGGVSTFRKASATLADQAEQLMRTLDAMGLSATQAPD